jgi:hypothetical protein
MNSGRPLLEDPDATIADLPRHKLAARERRQHAVRERIATGVSGDGYFFFAVCAGCGAGVPDWRRHLHQQKRTAEASSPTVAVLEYEDACGVCGGSVVELHAEDSPRRPAR